MQRLLENAVAVEGESRTTGDGRGVRLVPLYRQSGGSPLFGMDSYLHVRLQQDTCSFNKTEAPADLRQDKLSDHEMGQLMDLKRWIYNVRAEHRKGEDKVRRQEEKEQAKQEKGLYSLRCSSFKISSGLAGRRRERRSC